MMNRRILFILCCLIAAVLFCTPGYSLLQVQTLEPEVRDVPGVAVIDSDDGESQAVDSQPELDQQLAPAKPSKKDGTDRSTTSDFLRVRKDAQRKMVAFETSVTRYLSAKPDGTTITVDLIGVVHIGEKDYFQQLNQIFEQYDAVLFELVAPEGTTIPEGGMDDRGMNPVAALQKGMQAVLGLEFQLDHINYEKENLVHADMSPDEFLQSMKDNDESFTKMIFKAMGQSMAQSQRSSASNLDLLRVAFAKDKEMRMRQLFAGQMIDMEAGLAIFEGKEGSTIINHRNGKAFEILQREIDAGRKKLAIFYGAGHLPDMHRRLTSDMQMQRAGQYWLEAWKLKR